MNLSRRQVMLFAAAWPALVVPRLLAAAPASTIPSGALIEPADLAKQLRDGRAPHLIHVGFQPLWEQGHIPGSVYAGPGREAEGLDRLRSAVASLAKDAPIVLYCGCCPWSRCPNVAAAYESLVAAGYRHVSVLHVDQDFGTNWKDAGYPVATGA
jgi:rhodanese-related sulfurtransferase